MKPQEWELSEELNHSQISRAETGAVVWTGASHSTGQTGVPDRRKDASVDGIQAEKGILRWYASM